jgi:hypothetical protein
LGKLKILFKANNPVHLVAIAKDLGIIWVLLSVFCCRLSVVCCLLSVVWKLW